MRLLPFKINMLLLGGLALYFIATALVPLYGYYKLQITAPATLHDWRVIQKSSSAFAIEAVYTFEAQGKPFSHQTIFSKPYYLNQLSAERQIKIFSTQPWSVWYDAHNPTYSSLEKVFPMKKIIYALISVGVFGYFLYVRYTVLERG
jgi:hypothetical protein